MRTDLPFVESPSTEIDGHPTTSADKIVQRRFGRVCKLLWDKPDVEIANIEGCDPRTGRRILRGEGEISWRLMQAVCARMLEPI